MFFPWKRLIARNTPLSGRDLRIPFPLFSETHCHFPLELNTECNYFSFCLFDVIVRPPGHRPGLTDRHVIAASRPGLSQQLSQQEAASSRSSVHLAGGMGLAKETGLGL